MFKRALKKPDGRDLILYARHPIDPTIVATAPEGTSAVAPNPHLRFHPLRGEWVAYASYRQNRVFLPPKEFNPLAITRDPAFPTELPPGDYDLAVFENLSPALTRFAERPGEGYATPPGIETAPARGACEVVVFSRDPEQSLGRLPLWQIEMVIEVWGDRTRELGSRDDIQYVMPFENRGVEMGVTLHHPHGQIYAYPFVPPVGARELAEQRAYYASHGRGLLEHLIEIEIDDGRRTLYVGDHAVAFVPAFARYPYETWISPRRPVATYADLTPEVRRDFAVAIKTTLQKFDGLWGRPFPYLMATHQAPTDGQPHPEAHLHLELYPPYRTRDRLKYLAGTELGAGMFANDALPEEKAAELRAVEVPHGED